MKTMIRCVCATLLALGFATVRADAATAAFERYDTSTARARSGADVLPSWTGFIPGTAGDGMATAGGHHTAVAGARSAAEVLASWTGSIPAAARGEVAPASQDAGASTRGAAQALASWGAFSLRGPN
jgi:hypothetical protein